MCGLVGLITTRSHQLGLDPGVFDAMRDRLAHRGPDDASSWCDAHAALGHRRLAVLDRTDAGRQPFCAHSGRGVLVYNGELYNDAELRHTLAHNGVQFQTACDTETLWHVLDASSGPNESQSDVEGSIASLRGMFAFAWYEPSQGRLVLARDRLGIKPLYVWEGRLGGVPVVAFTSEIQALFAHPQIVPHADMLGVSAYLSNIRTVTGARTMFVGVRALQAGEVVHYDLNGDEPRVVRSRRLRVADWSRGDDFGEVFTESVKRHLRSDVPLCAMLSGGLDSSAICAVARPLLAELHTYCAGAPDAHEVDGVPQGDDFPAAMLVSDHLQTRHTTVPLDQAGFASGWAEMVGRLGVPLSTPNEVAINRMCLAMRAQGRVVTLSGEGADELLGGYEGPMAAAAAFVDKGEQDGGGFQLASNAWCPIDLKPVVMTESAWRGAEADTWLKNWYVETFERCAHETGCGLSAHLRFHREVNLTGLLGRLDSASMLASVEGRTPFADVAVAALAESLPMSQRYNPNTVERTKVVLRRSMGGLLPGSVVSRPKASFPLPFQIWMHDSTAVLDECAWIREVISPEALLLIRAQPAQNWRLAWPVINLALWGKRWWG